jgi:hypothetical protein
MPNFMTKEMRLWGAVRFGECLVVASRDALYVAPKDSRLSWAEVAGLGAVGGLVGIAGAALLSSANEGMVESAIHKSGATGNASQGVYSCKASELPPTVQGSPEWPLRQADLPVLVVPRGSAKLKHPKFSNELHLMLANRKVRLAYVMFTGGKFLGFLRENGWDIA